MTMFTELPEAFYSSLAADPDMSELVDMFVDEMPDRIASLQAQYDAANWTELGRLAHQMKGAAGSYGFNQLTPFAARLEGTVKEHKPETEIQSALSELTELCRRIRTGVAG
ncbi:MAG: Hpt domain-containing protein [Pirellulales bacterium]|nr:Hpt domain-containing protein [Pirellulales bacterium]